MIPPGGFCPRCLLMWSLSNLIRSFDAARADILAELPESTSQGTDGE
jgi:hypothetical protein